MAVTLSDQDLDFFREKNFAHLTTINADGSPQTTVLWVDVIDGQIVLNTADGRLKVGNIRRDPRVSLSVHRQDNPYASIIVSGRAQLAPERGERDADLLTKKFIGRESYPPEWRAPDEERVTISVTPERVHRYGY